MKEPGEGKRIGDFTWTPLAVTLCLRMFSLDKSSISFLLSALPWATLFTLPVPVTQVPMKTSELLLPISQARPQSDALSSVGEGRQRELHLSLLALEPETSWERNLLGVVSLDKLFPCLSGRNFPVDSSFRRLRGTREEKRARSKSDKKSSCYHCT